MDQLNVDLADLENALRSFFQTMKRPASWTRITDMAGVTIDRPAGAIIHVLLAAGTEHYHLQDLANALGIEAPSATRKTQELERAGYIERVPDPKDRRAVSFRLTTAGRQVGTKIKSAQREYLIQALVNWPSADRQQFVRLFERFSADLATSYDRKHK